MEGTPDRWIVFKAAYWADKADGPPMKKSKDQNACGLMVMMSKDLMTFAKKGSGLYGIGFT